MDVLYVVVCAGAPDGVLEAVVGRPGEHQVGSSQLLDVAQPLELRRVYEAQQQRVQLDVSVDGVVEHLHILIIYLSPLVYARTHARTHARTQLCCSSTHINSVAAAHTHTHTHQLCCSSTHMHARTQRPVPSWTPLRPARASEDSAGPACATLKA